MAKDTETKKVKETPESGPKPEAKPTCKPMQEGTGDAASSSGPNPEPE